MKALFDAVHQPIHFTKIGIFTALLTLSTPAFVRAASDDPPANPQPISLSTPSVSAIPDYDYAVTNGLYATITGCNGVKCKDFKDERVKLSSPLCKKEIEARVLWQNKPAPLVVILPGISMSAKDPEPRLWATTLFAAGNNVLMLDSPFRISFNEATQSGVTCNMEAEARVCGSLILSFLKTPKAHENVTRVGLFGASYGGVLALNLNRLTVTEHEKLPLTLDRVLVFSPPVNLKSTVALLDRYQLDREHDGFSIDLFQEMAGHKAVARGVVLPFTDPQMRGAVGYYFHELLTPTVISNNRQYKLEILEQEAGKVNEVMSDTDLDPVATHWTYTRYINEMVFPYWQKQGSISRVEDLWSMGSTETQLTYGSGRVHVVVTEDDPLNNAEDVQSLKRRFGSSTLTVLPYGGHLGYIGCNWAKDRLGKIFQ